jgi:ATP-binding cassette subfamily B protein
VIALLKERLTPYWRQIVLVLALLFVQAITNLYLPTLNADLINNGVVKGDTHYIVVTGAFMLGVTLVLAIATVIAVYWGSKTAMAFGRDVRGALFRKVENFSQAELNHFGTPSLITRATNDVQQVQMVVLMMLNLTLAAPIMAIGGIIMALRLDVPLSSVILVAVPVMGVFIGLVLTRALPLFRSMQKKIDRINQVTREVLSGVRVIRAFDRVGYEEQRFEVANADLTGTTLRVTRLFAVMMPTLILILNLSTVAIMWFGSVQVANHGMPIGDLTAFLTYILQILMSVLMATIMLVMVPRASASAERIQQVLHAEISVNDPETSSKTWSSATPAPRTPCSATSPLRVAPAK